MADNILGILSLSKKEYDGHGYKFNNRWDIQAKKLDGFLQVIHIYSASMYLPYFVGDKILWDLKVVNGIFFLFAGLNLVVGFFNYKILTNLNDTFFCFLSKLFYPAYE